MDSIQNAMDIFMHAVEAVKPSTLVPDHLRWQSPNLIINGNVIKLKSSSRLLVIGAGKASALMAQTLEEILGSAITNGIVVTKHEHGLVLNKIKLIEGGHPIPDENSVRATEEIVRLVSDLTPDDIVIFLLSGGASSLLADYPEGSNLTEVQQVFDLLLKSGADIHEMNTVRKHISNVKGGQLAKHIYPAQLYSLILSDVIGDDLDVIGSGPTVPDKSTFINAWGVLTKYNIINKIPATILQYIKDGCEDKIPDTPKEGDECFINANNIIIGSNKIALEAAASKASKLGYQPVIITNTLKGEASALGQMLARKAIEYKGTVPACLLYGGESTVTIKGNGLGGRNMELALAAGIDIVSHPNITILSAGTDGTDGPTDAAGAVVNSMIMKKAIDKSCNPVQYLQNNDSYNFFSNTNALIKTGATQTNVMDIMLALIH
jgi:glycerate 2-kinase